MPDRQRVLAVAIVVLITGIAAVLIVVGAVYSSEAILSLGVALIVVGPVIGASRMVIADQCEVISKLAAMLGENGTDLSDCEAHTESHGGQ